MPHLFQAALMVAIPMMPSSEKQEMLVAMDFSKSFLDSQATCVFFPPWTGQEAVLLLQHVFILKSASFPRLHPCAEGASSYQAQGWALRTDATWSLPSGCPLPECQVDRGMWGRGREDLPGRSAFTGILKGGEEWIKSILALGGA